MAGKSVIHKQVFSLETAQLTDTQVFEVPIDAEVVDIQWDTRDPMGIAIWYKTLVPIEGDRPRNRIHWILAVRGTGHDFPEEWLHLSVVVREGFAWHLFDTIKTLTWVEL